MFNEKRVKTIEEIYRKYKKYFGNKILDLCCGAGILGFIVEKDGKEYVGVDINENMIKLAKEYARKINSKCRFYLEDVRNFKIDEKFDTFTCLGNSLGHLTIFDWIEVMKNVNGMAKENSYFIIEYRDVVAMLYNKQWKELLVYKKDNKVWVDLSINIDVFEGKINKVAFSLDFKDKLEFYHTIWSPFILRAIMKLFGWECIKYEEKLEWDGYLEIYRKSNKDET